MFRYFIVLMVVGVTVNAYNDDEYVDAVIDMLLNGESKEFTQSIEDYEADNPVLISGIWKCGNCTDLNDSKLVYSEVNEVDADMENDDSVDIQIGLTLQDMRCVTVSSDVPGVVRRVSGSCSGDTVTLNVALAHHFIVRVYS